MELIEVIKPGMLTTIQDRGRLSFQKYGISACGAMDALSFRLANILVGNEENEAALEVTLVGPHLKFLADGMIAITGADLSPTINGVKVPLWKTIKVFEGDILRFGVSKDGSCRAYIAAGGGIDVPLVMGSRSTFTRGSFGGLEGRALAAGDILSIQASRSRSLSMEGRMIPPVYIPDFAKERKIRFILGPQSDEFTEEGVQTLCSSTYRILNESDRMGFRLEGPVVTHSTGPDIISDYITMGSIQVPGNGKPIVLMADCQMTGGYTKIGVVIGVDIPYLAQKKPGDAIQFEQVEVDEAQLLWKRQEQLISLMTINNK